MIKLNDISIKFGENIVINNFSLNLKENEKILLKGHSGCGKSSILKSILGFIKLHQGTIEVNGQILNERTIWELRTYCAYVPQEANLGTGNGKEYLYNILNYEANKHLTINDKEINILLDRFNLKEAILNQSIEELSGGEKQRLALISALFLKRKILLLDEPSSALDNRSTKIIIDALKKSEDITILAASHDNEWDAFADNIVEVSN